jgi:antitoxin YefM
MEAILTIQTTYTNARANLAALCNSVAEDRDVVIIHRRGAADVALIAADELDGLLETAHLLRSPENTKRLLTALARAREETLDPQTTEALRTEMGLTDAG